MSIYVEATWNVTNDGRVNIETLTFTDEERKRYKEADRIYNEMIKNGEIKES